MVEEEEKRIWIFSQTDLWRGDMRKQRQRNAVVVPAEGIADCAQKADRSLPPIAGHILDPHRGGPILKDDHVEASLTDGCCRTVWAGERQDQKSRRCQQTQPERQI